MVHWIQQFTTLMSSSRMAVIRTPGYTAMAFIVVFGKPI
jgi:hypothetical protein